MSNNLPTTFAEQLQAKLQTTIGDMIPPEAFRQITEAAIAKYTKETLPKQVEAELKEFFHGLIQAELRKPEWNSRWDTQGRQEASKMVSKIIVDNADVVLQRMIGNMAQIVVSQMIQSMPRPF